MNGPVSHAIWAPCNMVRGGLIAYAKWTGGILLHMQFTPPRTILHMQNVPPLCNTVPHFNINDNLVNFASSCEQYLSNVCKGGLLNTKCDKLKKVIY